MRQAANFDRNMLLLATQLAHESNMKTLLLSVLDSLLQTIDVRESNTITEAMVLIRCSIRLILKLLVEPAANECVRFWSKDTTSAHRVRLQTRTVQDTRGTF